MVLQRKSWELVGRRTEGLGKEGVLDHMVYPKSTSSQDLRMGPDLEIGCLHM